jgi:hypothetical protein
VTRGPQEVVNTLKASFVIIHRKLAGCPVHNSVGLGANIKVVNGLPQFLPPSVRKKLRTGSVRHYRVWGSLFTMYKAMYSSYGPPNLEPITRPWDITIDLQQFYDFIPKFWLLIRNKFFRGCLLNPELVVEKLNMLVTGGTNASTSWQSACLDAHAWTLQPTNWVREWIKNTGNIYIE